MAAANILELTTDNFDAEVKQSDKPVLVDFWAPWCGPCKMLSPILDELAGTFDGRVTIGKVNIDEHHQQDGLNFRLSVQRGSSFSDYQTVSEIFLRLLTKG